VHVEDLGDENYPSAATLERSRHPLPNEVARVVV